jgi:Na+/melibiose symporter-like transporter
VRDTGKKLDYLSFVYVIFGSVLFLLSFNQMETWGVTSPGVWLMLASGAFLVALFVRRCLQSSHPVLNFRVLGVKDFTMALIINSCISMALCLVPFVLAIYFQDILGYTPMMYGLILLIPAIFSIAGGPVAQWLYQRIDSRIIILTAMVLLAGGSLMLSRTTLATGLGVVIFWLCFRYLGIGLCSMPITDYGMSSLSREEAGHGTSIINWFKMMATSLSLSIFTMVLNLRIAHYGETMDLMNAQMRGIGDVFFYSGLILVFNIVMTLTLKNRRNLR